MTSAPSGSWQRAHRSGFLRPEPSRFLGRSAELARLDDAGGSRLVSIVGPAGIGKTRLALRYATTRENRFRSVWFCDLRDARDVEEMHVVVLRTLSIGDRSATHAADAATAVARALAARAGSLVVLDNLEHLLPAAAGTLRRWLAAAPDVRFVVTSRTPTGIAGEEVVALGALRVADAGEGSGEAVELFLERVRARSLGWAPAPVELPIIREIVRSLKGVPLAIELAAARIGADEPEDVLARVKRRSSPPPVTVAASEASAARAVARAFDLLSPVEQDALAQCSVFRGGFALRAAEHVVRLERGAVSEVVTGLAQKNLLQVVSHQPLRFGMCEGIRAIAGARLARASTAGDVQRRYVGWFVERAEAVDADANAAAAEVDVDDLRAVMSLGDATGAPHVVFRAAIALDALSLGSGLGSNELARLDEALRGAATSDLRLLSRALGVRSNAVFALGQVEEARRDAETALRLAREVGDAAQIGATRRAAANCAFQLGDMEGARAHLDAALGVEAERGDVSATAAVYGQLGSLCSSVGRAAESRRHYESALALALRARNKALETRATLGLAWCELESGERDEAERLYRRALGMAQRLRMRRVERITLGYLGVVHFDAGDLAAAEECLRECAFASRQAGDFRVEGIFEGIRGGVLAALGCVEEAAASLDLADELLTGNPFYAGTVSIHRGHLDLAHARAAASEGDAPAVLALVERAESRIRRARAAEDGAAPLVGRSDDARLAVRILRRAIDELTG